MSQVLSYIEKNLWDIFGGFVGLLALVIAFIEFKRQKSKKQRETPWQLYVNDRYGYNIRYPNDWQRGVESFRGDGSILYLGNPRVDIRVFASYLSGDYTPKKSKEDIIDKLNGYGEQLKQIILEHMKTLDNATTLEKFDRWKERVGKFIIRTLGKREYEKLKNLKYRPYSDVRSSISEYASYLAALIGEIKEYTEEYFDESAAALEAPIQYLTLDDGNEATLSVKETPESVIIEATLVVGLVTYTFNAKVTQQFFEKNEQVIIKVIRSLSVFRPEFPEKEGE